MLKIIGTANEWRRWHRQICSVEAAQRGELLTAQLVDALGSRKILEPMCAEVVKRFCVDEPGGRRGEKDLTAVAAGSDPRRPVNVDSDVALLGEKRSAAVDPNAHPNLPPGELLVRGPRRFERSGRDGKSDKESIPLRVHLDASTRAERRTKNAPVLSERRRVRLLA